MASGNNYFNFSASSKSASKMQTLKKKIKNLNHLLLMHFLAIHDHINLLFMNSLRLIKVL